MTDWVASRPRKIASGGPRKRQSDRLPADGCSGVRRSSRGTGNRGGNTRDAVAREGHSSVREVVARESTLPAREGGGEFAGPSASGDRSGNCSSTDYMMSSPSEPSAPHMRRDAGVGVARAVGGSPWPPSSAHQHGHVSADLAMPVWASTHRSHPGATEFEGGGPEILPPRPTTPCMNRGSDGTRRKRTNSAGASGRHSARGSRPSSGSVGARMSELESALLARSRQAVAASTPRPCAPEPFWGESRSGRESVLGTARDESPTPPSLAAVEPCPPPGIATGRSRPSSSSGRASVLASVRPSSSLGRHTGAPPFAPPLLGSGAAQLGSLNAPASLIEEAIIMCRSARCNGTSAPVAESPAGESPRMPLSRPNAPTPEQTNHWLHGMDQATERRSASKRAAAELRDGRGSGTPTAGSELRGRGEMRTPAQACNSSRSGSPDSPRSMSAILRPRSPTPTKMLAWEEAAMQQESTGLPNEALSGRMTAADEGRGDQTDGLIAQLIGACQMNEINKALTFYEKLRRMRVPLYEGVYKMIIECCMRTQQLGHAMQFYETLKVSGQRVSSRLAIVLMEACAKEQHGDKVHAIWSDWCPPGEPVTTKESEVLLVAVSALVRTMSPDLAQSVLADAIERSGDRLASCLSQYEVELEELMFLNEQVAEEAKANGTLLEELAGRFGELHCMLQSLLDQCTPNLCDRNRSSTAFDVEHLFMEDVDLDLELAAM